MSDEATTNQETAETPDTPVNMDSSPSGTSPEAIQAPADVSTPEVVNNTASENTGNKAEIAENGQNTENTFENQAPGIEPNPEPVSGPIPEPVQTLESQTAQIPGNEPFENTQDKPSSSQPEPINLVPAPVIIPSKNKVLELLNKAKLAIQSRKRKKLDKVMTMFAKQTKISNDEVEKFLHVSDATAERYLNILEKENKIKQVGKTGHSVNYIKI
jgi:hypothetical protein